MRVEMARNVMEHLNKFPIGYPASPDNDELKLLEVPFSLTDQKGELLCQVKDLNTIFLTNQSNSNSFSY
jgi:hypothetical protein